MVFAFLLSAGASVASAADSDRRVVVVVFDGMRPDFITADTAPNLWRLANEGVFFAHHHPVFLSATEVNGTAMATGTFPARSSIVANVEFRPDIHSQMPVGTEIPEVIVRGDQVSRGQYLLAPTVAEILHARGLPTAIAGSKQVVLLHDRAPRENATGVAASPIVYEGAVRPRSLAAGLAQSAGRFPEIGASLDKMDRDAWTTNALLGTLWKNEVPPFSLLWLAEPDASQHATGPGSAQSLAAIKSSDHKLGLVLAELEKRSLRGVTDVMVVSDHGFSTIGKRVDVAGELSKAGFASKRVAPGGLQKGDVLVVSNGGSTLIYIGASDADVTTRLVAHLQKQEWVGVVFSRREMEGTFPLREARIDAPQAPDLIVSLRWMEGLSATRTRGFHTSDADPASTKPGAHASLSRYDMHNTLVAAGPGFRRGVLNTLPSGNTDVAPTALWLLGFRDEAAKMDGRVLGEALSSAEAPKVKSFELNRLSARRVFENGVWEQYLQISEVNGVRYLDEGNGSFRAGR